MTEVSCVMLQSVRVWVLLLLLSILGAGCEEGSTPGRRGTGVNPGSSGGGPPPCGTGMYASGEQCWPMPVAPIAGPVCLLAKSLETCCVTAARSDEVAMNECLVATKTGAGDDPDDPVGSERCREGACPSVCEGVPSRAAWFDSTGKCVFVDECKSDADCRVVYSVSGCCACPIVASGFVVRSNPTLVRDPGEVVRSPHDGCADGGLDCDCQQRGATPRCKVGSSGLRRCVDGDPVEAENDAGSR